MLDMFDEYLHLMQEHDESFVLSKEEFFELITTNSERIIIIVSDDKVVATAQATLSLVPRHVYVKNVVAQSDNEQGWKDMALREIERVIARVWQMSSSQPIKS